MSDTAVITPPIQAPTNAGNDGGLQAAMKAQMEYVSSQQPSQAPPAPEPPQKAQEPVQDTISKEPAIDTPKEKESAPEPTKDAKKPWDKLAPDPEKEKVEGEPQDDHPDDAPKAQNAWTNIKRELKEARAKLAEWETQKAKTWEQEKAQWEAQRKELEERASQWSEDQLKEYQKLKERDAIEYVTQSKQYQEEAQEPWNRGNSAITEIADYSQIDVKAIKETLLEPNKLLRHEKLVELFGGSTKSLSEARVEILANQAMQAGEDLHKAAQAHERLTKDAATKREQVAQQERAAALKAQEEAKIVLRNAIAEVDSGIRVQLKDLVESGILAEKDLEAGSDGFDMQQDPMDLAFGTRSAHLMPILTKKIRSLVAENAQLKAERTARKAAQPGLKVNGSVHTGPRVPSLQEAMAAHRQWVPGT